MGTVLKYVSLVLLFIALGWKVYKEFIVPPPEAENIENSELREEQLELGDPEEKIEDFYGTMGGNRTRNGITTYYFSEAEIDVVNGKVSAIRNLTSAKGTLKAGGQTFSIDESNTIKKQN